MKKFIIDVREPSEYANSHVRGAINVPLSAFIDGKPQLRHIAFDDELIVYCNSGNRSGVAKKMLLQLGYRNVSNGINQLNTEKNLL